MLIGISGGAKAVTCTASDLVLAGCLLSEISIVSALKISEASSKADTGAAITASALPFPCNEIG